MLWTALLPLLKGAGVGAAIGAGTAAATGGNVGKGALLGAAGGGLMSAVTGGLGGAAAGKAGGAAGGKSAGWLSLFGGEGAKNAAANAKLAAMYPGTTVAGGTLGTTGAAAGAATAAPSLGTIAKQAAITSAIGGGIGAALPKYGQTTPMQPPPMSELNALETIMQLINRKGRL